MAASEVRSIRGPGMPLLIDDIDTDRIIPARYLRCVSFDGLGEHAFKDDRQQDPDHPFDREHHQDAKVLLSGRNFGCGSSREHAPQALMRWGIDAVIAESFAEIFFGNCTALGIPAVCADREHIEALVELVHADPTVHVEIDLDKREITVGDVTVPCTMPDSAHQSLTTGQWDFLGLLLENKDAIREKADSIPYMNSFA